MNNTKKMLKLSIISMALCIAMLLGTTYAWFTDTATSGSNKIVAGNLDIDLIMYSQSESKYVSISGTDAAIFGGQNSLMAQNDSTNTVWEPGKTQIVFLGVQNKGSLAVKYNIKLTVTDNGLADALEYAIIDGAKPSDLASVSNWAALKAVATQTGNVEAGEQTAAENGVLDEIAKGTKDETDYFALAIHMKETADNDYKSKDVVIDVMVEASQMTAEKDSFDDQYDKDTDGTPDDPDVTWFDCTKAGATPSDVLSVDFNKTAPTSYDATWAAPCGTTAYYIKDSKELTYVPKGETIKFTDENLIKFGSTPLPGFVDDEKVLKYCESDPDFSKIKTIDELKECNDGTVYHELAYWLSDDGKPTYCFSSVKSITGLKLWDVSDVTDFSYLFGNMFGLSNIETLDLSKWNTEKATNMCFMFNNCGKLVSLKLGEDWNTSNVTNLIYMFYMCESLEELDVSGFDTSKVVSMRAMFYGCTNLTKLDLKKFDTANVTDMSSMFGGCQNLTTLTLGDKWDTAKVTNFGSLFANCKAMETLPTSGWNTSSATNMCYMFYYCKSLTSVDVLSFDTSKVTDMSHMFEMGDQYEPASVITCIDIRSFDTSKVTNMIQMFADCANLEHIYVGSGWSVANVEYSYNMFYNDKQLIGEDEYDSLKVDHNYATLVKDGGYLETKEPD